MPTLSTIALFLLAAEALLIIPGPAVLYIVTRSIDQGRRAGLVSALVVQVGSLFHIAAAALGVSALLVSSATAFTAVKYAGAAYLVYLGVRTIAAGDDPHEAVAASPSKLTRVFSQGVLVNLLNPKTALFFLAFLPQFVDPERGSVVGQTLFLGGAFVVLGVCSDSLYALVAGAAGAWLKGNARFRRRRRYCSGGIYVALGVTTALASSERT